MESLRTWEIPYVHGSVSSLRGHNAITLVRSVCESEIAQPQYTRQVYSCDIALLGAHVDHCRATSCEVTYNQLSPWIATSGFSIDDRSTDFEYRVTYTATPLVELTATDFRFALRLRSVSPFTVHRQLALCENAYIQLAPRYPMEFDDIHEAYLWPLQNFLSFATDKPAAITDVRVWLDGFDTSVAVAFAHPFSSETIAEPVQMLFTYERVADRFGEILQRWLRLHEAFAPALEQFFGPAYGYHKLADSVFLSAAQAAESYHRRRFPPSHALVEKYSAKIDRIVAGLSKTDARWVRGKLRYAYEPTLSARLSELVRRLPEPFWLRMFASTEERDDVLSAIADWRNRLTHLTASTGEVATHMFDLRVFSNQLLTILKANLLLDLGFLPTDLERCFRDNDTYRRRARLVIRD